MSLVQSTCVLWLWDRRPKGRVVGLVFHVGSVSYARNVIVPSRGGYFFLGHLDGYSINCAAHVLRSCPSAVMYEMHTLLGSEFRASIPMSEALGMSLRGTICTDATIIDQQGGSLQL